MDTGKGYLEILKAAKNARDLQSEINAMEEKHPQHGGWFRVGETIELRGSTFRIASVSPTGLRLKVLKRGSEPKTNHE